MIKMNKDFLKSVFLLSTFLMVQLSISQLACIDSGLLPPVDAGVPMKEKNFDDHSQQHIESIADFSRFVLKESLTASMQTVKVIVSSFSEEKSRIVSFLDSNFYTLHDEWYWFRLLNNQKITALEQNSYKGSFKTIAEIYRWAKKQSSLPLGLKVTNDGRLYSARFYDLSLRVKPRFFGLANLHHIKSQKNGSQKEYWAFELEYTDNISHNSLRTFFKIFKKKLGSKIAQQIKWLVRSPTQEILAKRMENESLEYHDAILRYEDFIVPGEVKVYSEGISVGKLHIVSRDSGKRFSESTSTSLLLTEDIPDYLPSAAALLTAKPQTPLAHVNLLARNRGIPNLYVGDIHRNQEFDQYARAFAPVIIKAEKPNIFKYKAISNQEYQKWRELVSKDALFLPEIDFSQIPYFYKLAEHNLSEIVDLRPKLGGKSAGFLALLSNHTTQIPDSAIAISARSYAEHFNMMKAEVELLLHNKDFRKSKAFRYLLLEGRAAYLFRYQSASDRQYLDEKSALYDKTDAVSLILKAGGVRKMLRDLPIATATIELLESMLQTNFSHYAHTQGLRFRSSSTVEDIEGFNGAGLYNSNTGFLYAEALGSSRTVESALKRTWSSYWSAEAFEERRTAKIDHLSGHMAVLVHARFDDEYEVSNGVFTLTLFPEDQNITDVFPRAELDVNVQKGALSVTNPPVGSHAVAEVDQIILESDGALILNRVLASSELASGEFVLSDAELITLFTQAKAITKLWLTEENRHLSHWQQKRMLILDFEFRKMAKEWPALQVQSTAESRIIVKQARSLSPSKSHLPASLSGIAAPYDLLARTKSIVYHRCTSEKVSINMIEVYSDPQKWPDLGYAQKPFISTLVVEALQDLATGAEKGDKKRIYHSDFASQEVTKVPERLDFDYQLILKASKRDVQKIESLSLISAANSGFKYNIKYGDLVESGVFESCETSFLYASPEQYLEALLKEK